MKNPFRARVLRIQKRFRSERNECSLLVTSGADQIRSRNQEHPFRQNSDLFYLSGSRESGRALLITKKGVFFFAKRDDPHRLLWEGRSEDPKPIAKRIEAELVLANDLTKEIRARLKGTDLLYYQNIAGTLGDRIARELAAIPSHERTSSPSTFASADLLLVEMRLLKDPHEIKAIRAACDVTAHAMLMAAPMMHPGSTERLVGATVDYGIRAMGGVNGFGTIAASGPSAAILHYRHLRRSIRKGELLLLDCGAELDLYNGDITRVFPTDGVFSPVHADLYDAVLAAQRAAISKVRHGVLMKKVYDAAASELTYGLMELKVLRGKHSSLLAKRAYLPFFPHGIGHSLGIDVHDVGNLRGNTGVTLKAGMVITVEPGLYFPKRVGRVSPCGVRIEDDVHVTRGAPEVLSARMPKRRVEIESIMAS